MKVAGRKIVVGAMVCAVIGATTLLSWLSVEKASAAQRKTEQGQWVDPANPSDELVDGPYRVDPNWPKPLATLFPEEKGWTWGAVQGVFAQNPDRIFVAMRGELPDLTGLKKSYAGDRNRFRDQDASGGPWARHVRTKCIRRPLRQPGRSLRRLHGPGKQRLPLEAHHHGL